MRIAQGKSKRLALALLLVCAVGLLLLWRWYDLLPSRFMINGQKFVLSDNVEASAFDGQTDNGDSRLIGIYLGEITKRVAFFPQADGEGFKIPSGTDIYLLNASLPEFEQFGYTRLLLSVEGRCHLATLYLDKNDDREQQLEMMERLYA